MNDTMETDSKIKKNYFSYFLKIIPKFLFNQTKLIDSKMAKVLDLNLI